MKRASLIFVLIAMLFTSLMSVNAAPSQQEGCPEPRLTIGNLGRVLPGSANRIRSISSTSGDLVGEMPGGEVFKVIEGPVCGQGYNWWKIQWRGIEGWTVEGTTDDYFVEPYAPLANPTPTPTPGASAECTLPTRLTIGNRGESATNIPITVRDEPRAGGVRRGTIDPFNTFAILDGPVCRDGINWWNIDIESKGVKGWAAEGVDGEYLLQLIEIPPTPTPAYQGFIDPYQLTWNADGSLLAVGTGEGLYIYDMENTGSAPRHILPESRILELAFHPQREGVLTVNRRQLINDEGVFTLEHIDIETGETLSVFDGPRPIRPAAFGNFSADGSLMTYTHVAAYIIDQSTDETLQTINPVLPEDGGSMVGSVDNQFTQAVLSPDGQWLAAVNNLLNTGRVYIARLDAKNPELILLDRETQIGMINYVVFSSDSKRVYISDREGNIQSWNVETFERTSFIRRNDCAGDTCYLISSLAVHPDGSVIVASERAPRAIVRVFNAQTLQVVNAYDGGGSTFSALDVEYSPDGEYLAVIVDDRIEILETSGYTRVMELVAQRN